MRVKLLQTETHAPWQAGEIISVQVASVDADGAYACDTLDTFPADIKEQHAAEIARLTAPPTEAAKAN